MHVTYIGLKTIDPAGWSEDNLDALPIANHSCAARGARGRVDDGGLEDEGLGAGTRPAVREGRQWQACVSSCERGRQWQACVCGSSAAHAYTRARAHGCVPRILGGHIDKRVDIIVPNGRH